MLNVQGLVIDREYQESHSLWRYDPIHDCAQGFGAKDDVVKIAGGVMRDDESRVLSKHLEFIERFQGGVVIDRLIWVEAALQTVKGLYHATKSQQLSRQSDSCQHHVLR